MTGRDYSARGQTAPGIFAWGTETGNSYIHFIKFPPILRYTQNRYTEKNSFILLKALNQGNQDEPRHSFAHAAGMGLISKAFVYN